MNQAIILSLISTFLWAVNDVVGRYVIHVHHVHPVIYTCLYMIIGAGALIMIAGPGKGGLNTLRLPHTWSYGFLEIMMQVAQIFAVIYITTTEMNFLNRSTIFFSLALSWVFFGRRPYRSDIIGSVFVLVGIIMILNGLPDNIKLMAIILTSFIALIVTVETMIAEKHPESLKALNVKDQCRVVGYVTLGSAILLLLFMFFGMLVKHHNAMMAEIPVFAMMPDMADFLFVPTVLSGMIFGFLVVPVNMYTYFAAVKIAKTEVYLLVVVLLPFFTYILEWLASLFDLLTIHEITYVDMLGGVIMTLAAFYMIYARHKNHSENEDRCAIESSK